MQNSQEAQEAIITTKYPMLDWLLDLFQSCSWTVRIRIMIIVFWDCFSV